MRKSPLSNGVEKSTLFLHQVWLEYSVQIRVLACSVTFLCNYNEVPLGIEVSLCTDYSNEMECAMGCWWSLRYFLERNNLFKCVQNISNVQCILLTISLDNESAARPYKWDKWRNLEILDSSSLSSESFVLALVWPCLDITSLERNVNRIRPTPTQLPPNSSFSPPLLRCRATWSFPCTRHNLWLRLGGWRCVCATLLFQASGAPCAAVLRIQEKSFLRGLER